jgi:hypothetical protein
MVCQRIMVEKGVVVCCGIVVVIGCDFSKFLGSCSAYMAELWRVLKGLNLARSRGFTTIELSGFKGGGYVVKQLTMLQDIDW